jgi:hypothetical protein
MKLAAIVVFDSEDPALDPATISVSTVERTQAVRAAIVAALPDLVRAVAVPGEDEAKFMITAHHAAMTAAGVDGHFFRPPPEYRAPADRDAPHPAACPGAKPPLKRRGPR